MILSWKPLFLGFSTPVHLEMTKLFFKIALTEVRLWSGGGGGGVAYQEPRDCQKSSL